MVTMQQTLINYCVLFYGFISEPYSLQIMSDENIMCGTTYKHGTSVRFQDCVWNLQVAEIYKGIYKRKR